MQIFVLRRFPGLHVQFPGRQLKGCQTQNKTAKTKKPGKTRPIHENNLI